MSSFPITVHAINLPKRIDRKSNLIGQFLDKEEFSLRIVEPTSDPNAAKSLWNTIRNIIRKNLENDFVIICEDDHIFTQHYSARILQSSIGQAVNLNADLLLGGISWCKNAISINSNLFWVDKFSGLQFVVLFRKVYSKVLTVDFQDHDCADYKLSGLAKNKFVIYPFISIQKDYGYSDVTYKNNEKRRVEKLFENCSSSFAFLLKVEKYYKEFNGAMISEPNYNAISIPTYIINLPERTERLEHIKKEFAGRKEFDLTIVEACRHKIGAVGLWQSIRKIISLAIENNDDVIIICEDDHVFTEHYSKNTFIQNIIEAHTQGVDMLIGGVADAKYILPITEKRFWVGSFWSTQFIVLYRNIFSHIINEPYNDEITADGKLSESVVNKMVLFPFISTQKEFGYSDISAYYNNQRASNPPHKKFQDSFRKFELIKKIYQKHRNQLNTF
ncbi:hypothetical protein [Agriterribacter sp.]|uniref:hypothetical protein n=1 Tax=Agriterribacter sp. TaxID=2821509 RepID=UPI002C469FF7|nr:hypothetical protein [Agriterribacter sp.]HTN08417.1 hypothetical protein [Agriterribacter sp.]